jgi:uncharacterized membrane protein YfcA
MDGLGGWLPEGIGAGFALLLVSASFLTSALTAGFGIGGGVAMLVLMGLVLPVASLIPVHGAVQLGSNLGRAWHWRAHVRHSIAAPFIMGSLVGAVLGAMIVVRLPDAPLKLMLGVFVIAVTWVPIAGFRTLGGAGLAAGSALLALLGMFFGATGPLLSAFFAQLLPDDRRALIATHAAGMSVQHGLKVAAFWLAGFAFADWLPLIAVMIATGYFGTRLGSCLLDRLPEARFRRWFRMGLTLLALDLVRRGLAGLF